MITEYYVYIDPVIFIFKEIIRRHRHLPWRISNQVMFSLPHWDRSKMTFSNEFLKWKLWYFALCFIEVCCKPALFLTMTLHRTNGKSLPEPFRKIIFMVECYLLRLNTCVPTFTSTYELTEAFLSCFELIKIYLAIWSYTFLYQPLESCSKPLVVEGANTMSWWWFKTPMLTWRHGNNKGQVIDWPSDAFGTSHMTSQQWFGVNFVQASNDVFI